jgi:lipopolysaccharide transport system ATP-binding protein
MGTITVSNLGKAYKQYPNRWARLLEWISPSHKTRHSLKWVLQDISFQIGAGESVGIIGVNGAGKSTLLKMITGTTQPTTGRVEVSGRVAALLELGMGFHPDFTGRQNVFMAGQLQGLSVDEIHQLMPEIESFAAIGDYIDQPVRIYSSGMQVRLAFAVATAKRADVLIVDEALSVGDAAFQRKCFQRIESFRSEGTTLLFVSHDIETVKKLCDRAVFLLNGQLVACGDAKFICDEYEAFLFGGKSRLEGGKNKRDKLNDSIFDPSLSNDCRLVYGNGKVSIINERIEDSFGNVVNVISGEPKFYLRFTIEVHDTKIEHPCVNFQLKTTDGVVVYGINTDHLKVDRIKLIAGQKYEILFHFSNYLAPGVYFLTFGIKEGGAQGEEFCRRIVDGLILKIINRENSTVARGIIDLRASFSMKTTICL